WLDPNFIQAWDIAGWHVAYNLRAEAKTEEEKDEYVRQGCEILEEGIRWNSDVPDLFFQLAWTHYDKSGNLAAAIKWFKEAMKREHLKPGELPRTQHMLAHAYERLPDIPKALKTWKDDLKHPHFCGANRGAIETIQERYVIPWKLMQQGQYEKAIDLMDKLLEKPEHKYNSIARHVLAEIYRRMGDLETAQAIMEQWANTNKMDAGARFKAKMWKRELEKRRKIKLEQRREME
ncbi:MAG TPA: tetratricopeptide repeat protein, partial [Armatimonadetes bacterium]|nr:tetratricopeptide repeat protein [Armatimonadota bacterium]